MRGTQIIRDKDADGFYVGELGGRRGLVPSNMVSPVDDATAAAGGAGRSAPGVNHVPAAPDPMRGAGKAVSPPSPRRHHRHNGTLSPRGVYNLYCPLKCTSNINCSVNLNTKLNT